MVLSNKIKISLFAGMIILLCGGFFYKFIKDQVSKQTQQSPNDLIVHYDSESFLDVKNEMPRLGNDIRRYIERIKKLGKTDVSAFEKFQLAGKRVIQGYNDHYIVTPIFDSNNHYYGNWWMGTKSIQSLTDGRSNSFHFNIRRQHLPDKRIKDHLVVILDNINPKFCPGAIRSTEGIVADSNDIIIRDEKYSDGCAKNANGSIYYFISVAQREKKSGDSKWQMAQ